MFYNKFFKKIKITIAKWHLLHERTEAETSFAECFHFVETVAKAFLKIGLKLGDSVCIVATNRSEWCFSHFGAIEAGGIAVGIYPKYKKKQFFIF